MFKLQTNKAYLVNSRKALFMAISSIILEPVKILFNSIQMFVSLTIPSAESNVNS